MIDLDQLETDVKSAIADYPAGSSIVLDSHDVLALVAVVRAAMDVDAVSHLRDEFMQEELAALSEALAPFGKDKPSAAIRQETKE